MRVFWTPTARRALRRIREYIASDNPKAAKRMQRRLVERARPLGAHPEMGRAIPEYAAAGLRELPEGNYLIVYRVERDHVEVVTVYEGHRLLRLSELPEEVLEPHDDGDGGG